MYVESIVDLIYSCTYMYILYRIESNLYDLRQLGISWIPAGDEGTVPWLVPVRALRVQPTETNLET